MKRSTPIWIVIVVGLLALMWTVPVLGVFVTSLRPLSETAMGWWQTDEVTITLAAWKTVWSKYPIAEGMMASLQIALISTILTIAFSPAAAYAFHFLKFPFRRVFLIILINAYVLPQQVIIIPLFSLWREFGLIDNIWSVILPYVGMSFAWSVFLAKNFLEDFPTELIEAAKVDGCGPIASFFFVVLPNSFTVLAAMAILQFLWSWNSLLLPLLFLRTNEPMPVLLSRIAGTYEPNLHQQSAVAILTMIVPLVVFLALQKYFAAGAASRSGSKEL
ncbi:MAG: carbohydrate ABC transporter permease [Rhodobacteraceae bacterium]|nr:carbohydrate ABC transporter permease [Paracoccaceae bacterium]MCY4250431.1 carbohydrate ABC transporter permease [Paracoccaceae bacterium]